MWLILSYEIKWCLLACIRFVFLFYFNTWHNTLTRCNIIILDDNLLFILRSSELYLAHIRYCFAQKGVLLSLFLIIVKTLCASHVLVHDYFIMNVNIRNNVILRFMGSKNEENVNIVYTILRHLRRRTSHWRPLQFFFFTPSLFIINIHFIHISDLSHD